MKYDIQKCIFLVKKYYEFQSNALVKRAYRSKYKNETTQNNNTIFNMVSVKKTRSVAFMAHNPRRKRKVAKNKVKNLISGLTNFQVCQSGKQHLQFEFLQRSFLAFFMTICI